MCHFAVASTNALFCSASEWPLFFTVFFFLGSYSQRERRLDSALQVVGSSVALRGCSGRDISCLHAFTGCSLWVSATRMHSAGYSRDFPPFGRVGLRPTAAPLGPALHTHTPLLMIKLSAGCEY